MVDILQVKQGKDIATQYEIVSDGLLIKNEKGETIIKIPVMESEQSQQSGD